MAKEDFKMVVAENIRKERIARGISVEELARIMNITPGFLGLIERGKRGITSYNLSRIANIFQMDVSKLLTPGRDEDKSRVKKDAVQSKKQKITALIHQMNEHELEFIINTIKNLQELKKNN